MRLIPWVDNLYCFLIEMAVAGKITEEKNIL